MILYLKNRTEQEIPLGVSQHGMIGLADMNTGHRLKQPIYLMDGKQKPEDLLPATYRYGQRQCVASHLGVPLNVPDIDRATAPVVGGLPPGLIPVPKMARRAGSRHKPAFSIHE